MSSIIRTRFDTTEIWLLLEGGYTVLKSKLGIFIGDRLTVVINIDFLLRNQHQEYIIALGEARNNTPIVLKGANTMIYRDLTLYITPFALPRIHKQYRHLTNKSQPLSYVFTNLLPLWNYYVCTELR